MMSRRFFPMFVVMVAVAVSTFRATAQPASPIVVQAGFQTPESVLYDPTDDVYLVSNINGSPVAADGNGFISRIGPEGQVLALKWIDGATSGVTLNAPKGMAIAGDTLYVADITAVRMFDRKTGQPKGSISISGSTFLNDAAAGSDGTVYVTDSGFTATFSPSGSDAVHRIDRAGAVVTVARGTHLRNPNGVTVLSDGTVLLVSGGSDGELYALGPGGQRANVRRLPAGGLDGLEALSGGVLLISSWGGSAVYRVAPDGRAEPVVSNVRSPADIGYDGKRNRVLIPLFQENRVVIQPLR